MFCLSYVCLVVRTKDFVLGLFTVLYSCKTCIHVNCFEKCYFHRSKSSKAVKRNVDTHLLSECITFKMFTVHFRMWICSWLVFKLCKCLNKSFKNCYSDVQLVHVLYIFSTQCYYLCIILFRFCLSSYKTSPQRKLENNVLMGTFILTQSNLILTSYFHWRIIQRHWPCKHKTTSYCLLFIIAYLL